MVTISDKERVKERCPERFENMLNQDKVTKKIIKWFVSCNTCFWCRLEKMYHSLTCSCLGPFTILKSTIISVVAAYLPMSPGDLVVIRQS